MAKKLWALALVAPAVGCVMLAAAPASGAKGPGSTVDNGDVHYTLSSLGSAASLVERSRTGKLLQYEPVPGWWAFPVRTGRLLPLRSA